ncbi:MAG: DUF494 family protein [Candidatus Eiseniibacteriota bacterium]|jgi:uncharacterized protein Smg (DUF494 family)
MHDPTGDVVLFIVQQIRAYMNGDARALEDLSDWLESGEFDVTAVHSALQFILQILEPYCAGTFVEKGSHRKIHNRILDTAERSVLSREAYGHLLELRDRGDLDDLQLEMILNQVVGTQTETVGLDDIKRIINFVLFVSPDGESQGYLPQSGEDDLPLTH